MNKAILVGRLTKDPELKMTENTKREVCQFTIAVNRPYTNDDGERKADFINCVVWDKLAENLSKYQKKGNQVAVEGRIQTRNYDDQNGQKRYVTEVIVENIDFVGSRRDNAQGQASQSAPAMPSANFNNQPTSTEATPYDFSATPSSPAGANISSDPYAEFGSNIEINDDELPF